MAKELKTKVSTKKATSKKATVTKKSDKKKSIAAKSGSKKKATTEKKTRVQRAKSTSGKYKSVRHLMEVIFAKNADMAYDKIEAHVKKEFPSSKFQKTHYSWYKNQIISHSRTTER